MKSVSEIRWRQPMFGPDTEQHTFREGDRVRIARLSDNITSRSIIGHRGVITEIDDVSNSSVEMKCSTCGGWHTMHEQELDFFGDDLVQMLQEKAGIMEEAVEVDQAFVNLEDFLAVGMYKAGFERICIQDRAVPHGDPRFPRPVWQKYVYGVISKLAPFRVYGDALIKLANQAGGYLAEWHSYSLRKGYNSAITEEDLDTLTLEMPIRALMVAKTNTDMGEYDDIKDMVLYWLQDKHQIDIGAIYRALRDLGFSMGNWSHKDSQIVGALTEYRMRIEWKKGDGEGYETFRAWATGQWEWVGEFSVLIDDEGNNRNNFHGGFDEFLVKKKPGEPVEVEEVEDVPF